MFIILSLTLLSTAFAQKKLPDNYKEITTQAQKLVKENKYLDALPLMEQLAPYNQDDAEFLAHYGISVMTNSIILKTPEARKKERVRGLEILKRAKKLGTKNVRALHLLDSLPEDGGDSDNFTDEKPGVSEALREGEGFFGRGEYEKAFTSYEKAYKLDPKNYEAVLFMGDSLYAQRKFAESEFWFSKAADLDQNRETAFRYWGDALLYQKRFSESFDKFAEAMIAEPFSRMTWDSINRWGELSGSKIDLLEISPPGNKAYGDIDVDEKLLKAGNGTIHWRLYNEVRNEQNTKKGGKKSKHTLAEEVAAWKKVADAVRDEIRTGNLKNPDQSLINLVKVADAGLLEPYILLVRANGDYNEDYLAYRAANRAKMKKFIVEFMFGIINPVNELNAT